MIVITLAVAAIVNNNFTWSVTIVRRYCEEKLWSYESCGMCWNVQSGPSGNNIVIVLYWHLASEREQTASDRSPTPQLTGINLILE